MKLLMKSIFPKNRDDFWKGEFHTFKPRSQIIFSISQILFIRNMEIENSTVEVEQSKTPELDADMPKKGIPRLVIEKLVLENFKSYAGVKVCSCSSIFSSRKLVPFIRTLHRL